MKSQFIGEAIMLMMADRPDEMMILFDCGFIDTRGNLFCGLQGDIINGVSPSLNPKAWEGKWRRGAVIHDPAYCYHLFDRRTSDDALRDCWIHDGVNKTAADFFHGLVHACGGRAWNEPATKKDFDLRYVPEPLRIIPSDILVPDEFKPRFNSIRAECAEIRKSWK